MSIFITGATGYIGSYVVAQLLNQHNSKLNLLVRAESLSQAHQRLWRSLQLHLNWQQFQSLIPLRCSIYLGDLTKSNLGLHQSSYKKLITSTQSIIHCAASLNRKSSKSCFNVNLIKCVLNGF